MRIVCIWLIVSCYLWGRNTGSVGLPEEGSHEGGAIGDILQLGVYTFGQLLTFTQGVVCDASVFGFQINSSLTSCMAVGRNAWTQRVLMEMLRQGGSALHRRNRLEMVILRLNCYGH